MEKLVSVWEKPLSSMNPSTIPKWVKKGWGFQRRWEASTHPVSKMSSRRAKLYSWSDTILPCTRKRCGENPFDRSSPKYSRKEMEISIPSSSLSTSLPNPRVPFLNGCQTLQSLTLSSTKFTFTPKGRDSKADIEKKQRIRNSDKIANTIPVKFLQRFPREVHR